MVISAILVGLLATCGQWWFFGPITKCLVYPLTTGTLVGVFMGEPMTGMIAGATIQLIYLGWISAGGTMPSNTIVAGIFGTALTIMSGADPKMAVTFAIPFSMLGLLLNQVYMTVNAAWIHQADKLLEKGNIKGVRIMNYLPSFCMALLLYGVPVFAMIMFGSDWSQSMLNAIPGSIINALEVVGGIMPALGIAMLLNYLGKKTLMPWFFAGFFLTEYSKLDLTAVSIFAAVIAIILYFNDKKTTTAQQGEKKKVRRLSVNKKVEVKEVGQSTEVAEEITKTIDGPKKKLSKKTLIKTWLLTTSTEACYNYERLQALGIANLMITPIRALYDKVEDQVAGIGDTVMQGILFPILFGIGCSMALDGSYLGPIFATVVFEVLIFACGYFMFMTGYKQGKTSLLKILKDGTVDKIINSFSIVGLMVVGSMAATRVAVDTPLAIKVGEGVTKIQTVLNSLAPGLIPLGITMLVWWMLRKKVNTLWIIVAIFVVGIIGYYTGILGYVG